MADYADFSFSVKPETLYQKSEVVLSEIQKMKSEFESLQNIVNRMPLYWQGEASDTYRAEYGSINPDLNQMFRRLMEHVTDLKKMSAQYSDAEKVNEQLANELPADVIE